MPAGSIAPRGQVKVRGFEAGDGPGVLELLQETFGDWPRDFKGIAPSEFFRWKHMDGPLGPSKLLVAEADDVVVGFLAYMPWRFLASGQVLSTMRGVDLAVHRSYRQLGVSMAIRAEANPPSSVAFIWSTPNEQSHAGQLKSGRRDVRNLPRFVRPCRRVVGDATRRACARAAKAAEYLHVEAHTAGEVLRDGERASWLLAQPLKPSGHLATFKNLYYLQWRYAQFEEYRAITVEASASGRGMAIFRRRRHGSCWVSHVCELFVEQNDPRTMRRLFRGVREAAPADFISCNFSSRLHAARYGFVQRRGGTFLTIYPLQQNLTPDPTRRSSWMLSLGDLELL
jgi:hypothetical protein